eukprot:Skav205852  [mRNA]  locus=scaffold766:49353:50171:- [translate_table: standard]
MASLMFPAVKAVSVPNRLCKRIVCLNRTKPAVLIVVTMRLRSGAVTRSGQQTSVLISANGEGIRSNSKPPTKASTGCADMV